jgi:hypothetical protein
MNLTDIYRIFHPIAPEHTFYSATHGTFSKIDHILGHKENLNKHNKFSDDNEIKFRYQQQEKLQKVYKHIDMEQHTYE